MEDLKQSIIAEIKKIENQQILENLDTIIKDYVMYYLQTNEVD